MTSPHERLDAAMDSRRLDLNMTWQDVAQAASVSPATLRAVRTGVNAPSALTRRRLEDALHWQRGSIDAIFEGGEPTVVDAPNGDDPLPPLPTEPAALRDELRRIMHDQEELSERTRRVLERLDEQAGHDRHRGSAG